MAEESDYTLSIKNLIMKNNLSYSRNALKMKKWRIVDIILYFMVLLHTLIFSISHFDCEKNKWVYVGFVIIGGLSFSGIVLSKRSISVFRMICIFTYIFFFMAPWQQYSEGSKSIWEGIHCNYTEEMYLRANVAIILFLFFFFCGYLWESRCKIKDGNKSSIKPMMESKLRCFFTMITIVAFVLLCVCNNLTGHINEITGNLNIDTQITNIVRFTPIYALISYATFGEHETIKCRIRKLFSYKEIFLIIAAFLLIFNPLYGWQSRSNWLIPFTIVVAIFFYDMLPKSFVFFGMYYALVVLFTPLKQLTLESFNPYIFINKVDLNYYDYDAYQMLMMIMNYTDHVGVSFGKNIVSALAFLIPRSIWKGKMTATSVLAATYYGATFTNISSPLIAEFYFAFSYAGCIFGALGLGVLLSGIDHWCDSNSILKRNLFCISVGYTHFLCRGALLPVLSFELGSFLPIMLVAGWQWIDNKMLTIRSKLKK